MRRIKCFMVEPCSGGFRNLETGEVTTRCPTGGMFFANQSWAEAIGRLGPDGRHLVVQTPAGPWHIDDRAGNCTRPDDAVHRCWVRHGEAPLITVDKNGDSCGCGCSIGIPVNGPLAYHAFLRDGYLEDC